jgi:hypothetical protein
MLHFGKEYLAWSVRSVRHAVDELHFLYAPRPSHGHGTDAVCPETEEELHAEAQRWADRPIHWHRGEWPHEGAHHDAIYPIAQERGVGQILRMDCDEIWDADEVTRALDASERMPHKALRVWMLNWWRSFDWVCDDPCRPHRIINPAGEGLEAYLDTQRVPILHMGYAQSVRLLEYKMQVQSHHAELRPEWLATKYRTWTPEGGPHVDLHPTCVGPPPNYFWHARRVTDVERALVDQLLGDHSYYGLPLIP